MRDLVIIGGGPAGMTAAVYAARQRLNLEMLTEDIGGQATWSWSVENYMGFTFIKGTDLMNRFEEHMREFDFPVTLKKVGRVDRIDSGFEVKTEEGSSVEAKVVLVASGKAPRHLNAPGEERLIGRGVAYCATCDAPLFKDMDVVIVGGGNSALQSAIEILGYARRVHIVSIFDWTGDRVLKDKLASMKNVTAYKYSEVAEIEGEKLVTGVRIRSTETGEETRVEARGVFIEIGQVPNSSMVEHLVDVNKYNEIMIDCACNTNTPGLFAAGDVTNVPHKQIIISAGEGAKAALTAFSYLLKHHGDVRKAA